MGGGLSLVGAGFIPVRKAEIGIPTTGGLKARPYSSIMPKNHAQQSMTPCIKQSIGLVEKSMLGTAPVSPERSRPPGGPIQSAL